MRINKINQTKKKIDKDGIIYALIFLLYAVISVLIFIYAINFLRASINTALSTPDNTEVENRYGQLDLENYLLVANKLGLKKSSPIATTTKIITENITTSSPVTIEASSSVFSEVESTEVIVEELKVEEKKPNITIINSTLKSGLAANLKSKLATAGYTVLSTGNSRPALDITTIRVKGSINPDSEYLAEIKKIVDLSYDFVILDLDENAKSDLEIIIGNK